MTMTVRTVHQCRLAVRWFRHWTIAHRLIGIVGVDLVALALARTAAVAVMAFATIAYARDIRDIRFAVGRFAWRGDCRGNRAGMRRR